MGTEGEPLLGLLVPDGWQSARSAIDGAFVADTAGGLNAAHELKSLAGERMELVHHDVRSATTSCSTTAR
jgi:hypothetical protein